MTGRARFDAIRIALVFSLFALATAGCNVTRMRNAGMAMSPTITDGQRVLVTRYVGTLQRGDIISFGFPEDPSKTLVKRVVGLPGERIASRDGRIFINGQELAEPYVAGEASRSHDTFPERAIPNDAYFVLGDLRNNSSDSRTWGPVPAALVRGKVILTF